MKDKPQDEINKELEQELEIKAWFTLARSHSSRGSIMIYVPKFLAEKYKLTEPSDILIVDNGNGILIRKVKINRSFEL